MPPTISVTEERRSPSRTLHPVSITRFPLTRFSPGSGLLRNPFVHRWRLRFSRVWVRKDGNLVTETRCSAPAETQNVLFPKRPIDSGYSLQGGAVGGGAVDGGSII